MKSHSQKIVELVYESLKLTGQQMDESLLEAIKEHARNHVRQGQALRRILEQAHESLKKRRRADLSNRYLQKLFNKKSPYALQASIGAEMERL